MKWRCQRGQGWAGAIAAMVIAGLITYTLIYYIFPMIYIQTYTPDSLSPENVPKISDLLWDVIRNDDGSVTISFQDPYDNTTSAHMTITDWDNRDVVVEMDFIGSSFTYIWSDVDNSKPYSVALYVDHNYFGDNRSLGNKGIEPTDPSSVTITWFF